ALATLSFGVASSASKAPETSIKAAQSACVFINNLNWCVQGSTGYERTLPPSGQKASAIAGRVSVPQLILRRAAEWRGFGHGECILRLAGGRFRGRAAAPPFLATHRTCPAPGWHGRSRRRVFGRWRR